MENQPQQSMSAQEQAPQEQQSKKSPKKLLVRVIISFVLALGFGLWSATTLFGTFMTQQQLASEELGSIARFLGGLILALPALIFYAAAVVSAQRVKDRPWVVWVVYGIGILFFLAAIFGFFDPRG